MKRCVVEVEIYRVRCFFEEVVFAAFAGPSSIHFLAALSAGEVEQVRRVVGAVGPQLRLLDEVWATLRQPGVVNVFRRCLMRSLVLQQLQRVRGLLDAVRVGHHVRWSAPEAVQL